MIGSIHIDRMIAPEIYDGAFFMPARKEPANETT